MLSKESKAIKIAQLFLGLAFTVFGLNGFLHFMPQPQPGPEAGAFLGALAATGYMFPLIKGTEVVAGVLLLLGRAPSLALILLAPIAVNIVAYHAALDPAGSAIGILLSVVMLVVAWARRDDYRALFTSSAPLLKRDEASGRAAHA
jgi:uncharacterized membrane protein YphA (DoxX/SURF4 family)